MSGHYGLERSEFLVRAIKGPLVIHILLNVIFVLDYVISAAWIVDLDNGALFLLHGLRDGGRRLDYVEIVAELQLPSCRWLLTLGWRAASQPRRHNVESLAAFDHISDDIIVFLVMLIAFREKVGGAAVHADGPPRGHQGGPRLSMLGLSVLAHTYPLIQAITLIERVIFSFIRDS